MRRALHGLYDAATTEGLRPTTMRTGEHKGAKEILTVKYAKKSGTDSGGFGRILTMGSH
jgi:hypothetical protein